MSATPPVGEALCCTKCGHQVSAVEIVEGFLDWGPAIVDDEGVVRTLTEPDDVPVVMADNSTSKGVWAHCDNRECGHRWKLRRRCAPGVGS